MEVVVTFRCSTEVTADQLKQRTHDILDRFGLQYDIDWTVNGLPFLTGHGPLVDAARQAIAEVTGYNTELSTAGGTSDGRFIAPTGTQVVELGPTNATIHEVDEHTSISELDTLTQIYERLLQHLMNSASYPPHS